MKCILSFAIFPILVCGCSFQNESGSNGKQGPAREQPDSPDRKSVRIGTSNNSLPKQVQAAIGELTLFADYAAATERGVPVYMVNRMSVPVDFRAQNGDIYLKLEYEAEPGRWVRAHPHAFSWCGNSYFDSPKLRANAYTIVNGYAPRQGTKANVRYALYHQKFKASSNQGIGLVDKSDIESQPMML